MGLIILDRDNEGGALLTQLRTQMKNSPHMAGGHADAESAEFREGYRHGYKHGWEDHLKEVHGMPEEDFRRGRDSMGRFT